MRTIFVILVLTLGFVSCNNQKEKRIPKQVVKNVTQEIKLHQFKKHFVTGNFDGKGKIDTLFEHNYSHKTKTEIENAADPFQNEWEMVIKWFDEQNSNLYLAAGKKRLDTLNLGTAHGLYCLINIGDTNKDGKDEIALVIDYLDYSRVNSCKIYSLCRGKWKLLKQFGVHEGAFDFPAGNPKMFYEIKDFLEKKNGKWFYKDYLNDSYETQEEVGKMKILKAANCQ